MKNFKEVIWNKEGTHIEYESLNSTLIIELMNRLSCMYNISAKILNSSSMFVDIFDLFDKKIVLLDINNSDGFENICSSINISDNINEPIYVIWNYDEVDKISINTLRKYWDYIWYGASDEMCLLYFPQSKLLLLVTDYGTIYLM